MTKFKFKGDESFRDLQNANKTVENAEGGLSTYDENGVLRRYSSFFNKTEVLIMKTIYFDEQGTSILKLFDYKDYGYRQFYKHDRHGNIKWIKFEPLNNPLTESDEAGVFFAVHGITYESAPDFAKQYKAEILAEVDEIFKLFIKHTAEVK